MNSVQLMDANPQWQGPTIAPSPIAAQFVADVTTPQRLGRANTLTMWRTRVGYVLIPCLSLAVFLIGKLADTGWSDPDLYPIGWLGVLIACTVPVSIIAACVTALRTVIPSPLEQRYGFAGAHMVAHYYRDSFELWTPVEHSTIPYTRIKQVITFRDTIVLYFGHSLRYAMPRPLVPDPALNLLIASTKAR
jgi:hypothetical protein